MKKLFLIVTLCLGIQQANSNQTNVLPLLLIPNHHGPELVLQPGEQEKMSANTFKLQDYCRLELKDFEYEVQFVIVSAKVYFTGANFRGIEQGTINSSSLRPVKNLMNRCTQGSIVTFDEIRIKSPDNKIRTIPGVSYVLF